MTGPLQRLQALFLRFARDEEGAVLAISILSFLFLFVSSFSVYAVGETVRQRLELQNAADAAAYSAAVVQADTLSRVAAINRAMAWTYVMLGRMEMDAIVDSWLDLALTVWEPEKEAARLFSLPSSCNVGDWYAGESRYVNKEALRLNKRLWVPASRIRSTLVAANAARKSRAALLPDIELFRETLARMNDAEEELLLKLPDRIEHTVIEVLRKNLKDTPNDLEAGGADLSFALLQSPSPLLDYTEIIEQGEESRFLNFTEVWDDPRDAFGTGTDDWWVLEPSGPGIQRRYRQSSRLVAEWDWHGALWTQTNLGCVVSGSISGSTSVTGAMAVDGTRHAETELCKPRKLTRDFFGRRGSIVVGVARRLNNPLYFAFGTKGQEGIFRAFTLDEEGRFMWTAASARAGYNRNWPGQSRGEYDPTWWNIDAHNLMNTDWDALLLPLYRAFSPAPTGAFAGGGTAGEVLSELSAAWRPLSSGGGAPGIQSAPPGMSGGAPDWGALNAWRIQ